MWTVIGSLSFCLIGFTFVLASNDPPVRPQMRSQPETRILMQDVLAPLGSSGNRPTCVHDGRWYYERSVIPTIDSCINCKCENGMVRCNMTLCPMYPNVQDGCQLTHEEGSCCPQLVCTENVAKKLASVPEIHDATLLGCSYNDFEFGLGDFIPTSNPCQACYCIHNRTQCVHQNCALPESAREGCRPVYHHGICCPIRYDCAEAMAIPPTQRPAFTTEGCAVNNKLYDEGEAIPSGKPCEHCYCMKGEMICAMQKCDSPMAGCVPVIKEGQCCPERFECPNIATTPAPWNNTGAVFAEPTAKRKLTLNITIETKFPHHEQPQQKFSSTTRALDDDNSLLGDLQHTTSPTVTSTAPSALPAELNVTQSGLPTVQPTAAQLGFQSTLLSGNRSAQLTMRINGTQQFLNNNFRVPPRPPGLSSPWLPSNSLNQGGSFDSNTDVLQYNIAQNKVAPVSASEIFNSGAPLGTRQPILNLSSLADPQPTGQTVSDVLAAFLSSSLYPTAPPVNNSSLPVNANPTDRLITHLVGGSTSVSSSSSSDIPLNSKINVTGGTSIPVNGPVVISLNGTTIPLASGSKLIASASGNSSVRAVLLAPLDPSPLDPYEGFIRAPVHLTNKNLTMMIALDPSSNAEIEGAASVSSPVEKLVMQVPFAHLTDFGLVVQDPSSSDQFEGQITTGNESKTRNSSFDSKSKLSPLDPMSPGEIEGWLRSPSIVPLQLTNSTAVAVDVKTVSSSLAAVDPHSNSEIEGALSLANPMEKISISALPLDPDSQSQIEGLSSLTDLSQKSGPQVQPPFDPSRSSQVILNSSTMPIITAVLRPLDPAHLAELEGTLNAAQNVTNIRPAVSVAAKYPMDPSQAGDVEGALSTSTKIRPAAPGSLSPTDPVPSDQFEGVALLRPLSVSSDQVGGAAVALKPLINKPLNLTNNRILENSGMVFDPTSAGDVEGVLAWSNPVQKVGDGLLHPFDPAAADNIEGLLSSKSFIKMSPSVNKTVRKAVRPLSPPVEPEPTDNVEGIWNTAQLISILNQSAAPIQVEQIMNFNQSSSLSQGVDQLNEKNATLSVAQNATTATIPLASKQIINVGGAAVTTENSSLSVIPTKKPSTFQPLIKANGSVPANLMMSIDAAKDVSGYDRKTRPFPLNLTSSGSSNINESKIIVLPADPETTDDVEGQLNQIRVPSSVVAVEPLPTDEYEGVERPIAAAIVKPGVSTKAPWAIYTNQHNDSSVSRWVIRTQNSQGSTGRNITWLPGVPIEGAQQAVLVTASSTSPPTTPVVLTSSTSLPTTLTATKISAQNFSTVTAIALSRRPTTILSSTTSSPSPFSTLRWLNSELSTTPITTTTELLEGAPDIQSVLRSSNLDKLSSMRIKENRRPTATATTVESGSTAAFDINTTSAPIRAGLPRTPVSTNESLSMSSGFAPGEPLTGIYENGCFYDGVYYRNYQSVPTGDLVDPCMVRLCKEGVILGPSEQRCPPPIEGCFSTSIPGVCCPVYLCPNYLERNETSYTLRAATGDTLNTEKTKLALAKFCRVGPRFLALNERVVHVMGVQCQTCTCKPKGIVCEPGCAQSVLITTEMPPVMAPRRFQTVSTTSTTTLASTLPPVTEPPGARSCVIQKKRFQNGDEVSFNDPCHICNCMDGLVICKINRKGCRSAKLLSASESLF